MLTPDGSLSQTGLTRIRNAVLVKAYGDSPATLKMTESVDDNIRNVTAALTRAAPKMAALREGIARGAFHKLDIAPDLAGAAAKLSMLREQGQKVDDYLRQQNLFGSELTAAQREIIEMLARHGRSAKKLGDIFTGYADKAMAMGHPAQGNLLGDELTPPTKEAILRETEREAASGSERDGREGQGALFHQTPLAYPEGEPDGGTAAAGDASGRPRQMAGRGGAGGDQPAGRDQGLTPASATQKKFLSRLKNAAYDPRGEYFVILKREGEAPAIPAGHEKVYENSARLFVRRSSAPHTEIRTTPEVFQILGVKPGQLEAKIRKATQQGGRSHLRSGELPYGEVSYQVLAGLTNPASVESPSENTIPPDKPERKPRESRAASDQPLLAPNGKPSKLTRGQWEQTRTPEFKAWFGDWEAAALARMPREAGTLGEAETAAQEFVNQPLVNKAGGMTATVSGRALGKMVSGSAVGKSISPEAHALAVANLDRLFGNALLSEIAPDRANDENIKAIHRFAAPMFLGDELLRVNLLVKELARPDQGNRLYTVEAVEIAKPARNWTDSTVARKRPTSAPHAGLDSNIDAWFEEIKSASKVVDGNGEPMVVYHGTAYDFSVFAKEKGGGIHFHTRR